jgi:hypothetical protein
MRFVIRGLAMAATSVALLSGVIGCTENNDQALKDATEGKSKVDPKAATNYEQLAPKGPPMTPPAGVSLPPPAKSSPAPEKKAEPAPEKKD